MASIDGRLAVHEISCEAAFWSKRRRNQSVSIQGIVGEHLLTRSHLLAIIQARNPSAFLFCQCQRRKQKACENGNDGNDDEEFNQRKGIGTRRWFFHTAGYGSKLLFGKMEF